MQGEITVVARRTAPVQRQALLAGNSTLLDPVPAHRQPQFGTLVAAVGNERHEVAVAHRPVTDLEGRDKARVPGCFVVKGKVTVQRRQVAVLHQPTGMGQPAQCLHWAARRKGLQFVGRPRRVERQRMLDVGEQQLLVLLLVLQAQLEQGAQGGLLVCGQPLRRADQCQHACINLPAVAQHFSQCGPADLAALMPRMLVADPVVVAVKKHPEAGVKRLEAGLKTFEQKSL